MIMKKIILTLIIFAFSLSIVSAQENAAKRALAEGDYQAAIKLYKVVIATSNDETQSANIYNEIKNAQKCDELLSQANKAYKKKKYSEAKKLYQSILKYNPSDKFSKKRVSLCSNNTSQQNKSNTSTQNTTTVSKPSKGTANGHEYVDLGLSVNWATCNVGANKPEQYGNYYAWGETETKSVYKQNNSLTRGKNINDISGNVNYDVARANWGGSWRMPTKTEFEELKYKCTWIPTTQNGVKGCKVVGPNGNYIFLPAGGSFYESSGKVAGNVGRFGRFWSSTPYTTGSAYQLSIDSQGSRGSQSSVYNGFGRHEGNSIRPVCDKDVKTNNTTSQQNNSNVQNTTSQQNSANVKSTTSQQNNDNVKTTTNVYRPSNGTANGHEYVDLGLPSGLKWATCNVGAKSPEKPGNYYAWGEKRIKLTYPYDGGNYGKVMNDFSGDERYDAARANWGGNWRTPTTAEFRELLDECTWENTKLNGKYGYKVTGPNGNSIFLPAAGNMTSKSNNGVGSSGHYWTSTPTRYTDFGAQLIFDYFKPRLWGEERRGDGASIRPVIE